MSALGMLVGLPMLALLAITSKICNLLFMLILLALALLIPC